MGRDAYLQPTICKTCDGKCYDSHKTIRSRDPREPELMVTWPTTLLCVASSEDMQCQYCNGDGCTEETARNYKISAVPCNGNGKAVISIPCKHLEFLDASTKEWLTFEKSKTKRLRAAIEQAQIDELQRHRINRRLIEEQQRSTETLSVSYHV